MEFSKSDIDAVKSLGKCLAESGYNGELKDVSDVSAATAPGLKYKYRDDSPVNFLIRLFLLRQTIDAPQIARLFNSDTVKTLRGLGILKESDGGSVGAAMKISPFKDLSLLCDYSHEDKMDTVYTPGADSTALARAGVRIPFGKGLDLCTGSGIQALMGSRHTSQTTAVDINPRAVRIAQLNAVLNGIDNVEVIEGDLYGAVGSETFDYITANPPFVTSQET